MKKRKKGLKRSSNGSLVPAKGYKYVKGGGLVKVDGNRSVNGLGTVKGSAISVKLMDGGKMVGGFLMGFLVSRALSNSINSGLKLDGKMKVIPPGVMLLGGATGAVLFPKDSLWKFVSAGASVSGLLDSIIAFINPSSPFKNIDNPTPIEWFKGSPAPSIAPDAAALGQTFLQLPGSVDLPMLSKNTTILGLGDLDPDKIL